MVIREREHHAGTERIELRRARCLSGILQMLNGRPELISLKLDSTKNSMSVVNSVAVVPVFPVPLGKREELVCQGVGVIEIIFAECALRSRTEAEQAWIGPTADRPKDVYT